MLDAEGRLKTRHKPHSRPTKTLSTSALTLLRTSHPDAGLPVATNTRVLVRVVRVGEQGDTYGGPQAIASANFSNPAVAQVTDVVVDGRTAFIWVAVTGEGRGTLEVVSPDADLTSDSATMEFSSRTLDHVEFNPTCPSGQILPGDVHELPYSLMDAQGRELFGDISLSVTLMNESDQLHPLEPDPRERWVEPNTLYLDPAQGTYTLKSALEPGMEHRLTFVATSEVDALDVFNANPNERSTGEFGVLQGQARLTIGGEEICLERSVSSALRWTVLEGDSERCTGVIGSRDLATWRLENKGAQPCLGEMAIVDNERVEPLRLEVP